VGFKLIPDATVQREFQLVSSCHPVGLILGFAVQLGAVALVNEVLLVEVAVVEGSCRHYILFHKGRTM
jgi:hypothetical protein